MALYRNSMLVCLAMFGLAASVAAADRPAAPAQARAQAQAKGMADFIAQAPASPPSMFDPRVKFAAYDDAPTPVPEEVSHGEGEYFEEDAGLQPELQPEADQGPWFSGPDPYEPAPLVSSADWLRNGFWYTQQSAVYISRSVAVRNHILLSTDLSSSTQPQFRNAMKVAPGSGYEPGLRSTLGRYLGRDDRNRDHSIEFTFLGLTHWVDAQSLTAKINGGIQTGLEVDPAVPIPVWNFANEQGYTLQSDLNSYEFNYRIDRRLSRDRMVYSRDSTWIRQATPALLPSVFAGIRYIAVNESIFYFSNASLGNGTYFTTTHNNMVGPQVGGDLFFERHEWRVGGRLKGGTLVNWASQSSTVRTVDANGTPLIPNRDEYVKDHSLSFVGEISFIGEYRFKPNFGIRASYDLMWVTDLALAQNQLNFDPSSPPVISNSHSLFFQGVAIGVEWNR